MVRRCRLGVLAALTVCVLPSTATAMPCAASTAGQLSTADGAGDETDGRGNPDPAHTAPDVSSVDIATDAQCNLTFGVTLGDHASSPGALLPGERVWFHLDTDGNPATGNDDGTDALVLNSTLPDGRDRSLLWVWIGRRFFLRGALPPAAPWARRTLPFASLGINRPTMLTVYAEADAATRAYRDSVPSFGVPVQFAGPEPHPRARGCTVPAIRGLTLDQALDRMLGAGCPFRVLIGRSRYVPRGRAYTTRPLARTSTRARVEIWMSYDYA